MHSRQAKCALSGDEVGRTPLQTPSEIDIGSISGRGGGGLVYEWRGKGRRGGGTEGGWTSRTLQCAVLSALPSRSGTWRGIRPVISPFCRTSVGEGGAGGGWWLRKRCGGEERMGWRCSCQLAMALMQLTVDARCVCGAASHVVTALDGSPALLRFQGASGEK